MTTHPLGHRATQYLTTLDRWSKQQLRRRLLTGAWRPDLQTRLRELLGETRLRLIGTADQSSNVAADLAGQLACLYDIEPTVSHDDKGAQTIMRSALSEACWHSHLGNIQRMTLGTGDYLLRVEVLPNDALSLREVQPDLCEVRPDPANPAQPRAIWIYHDLDGGRVVEHLDADARIWTVFDKDGNDATHRLYGEGVTLEWAWGSEGDSYLPIVAYHATVRDRFWDPDHWMEVVDGTLTVGVLWTIFAHAMRNAAWPQRYVIGGQIRASGTSDNGTPWTVADPTTVLEIEASRELAEIGGQITAGQWAPGMDPSSAFDACAKFEARVATRAGVAASDLVRTSDPRSGYALVIDREKQRDAARRLRPVFLPSDQQLLRVIARVLGLPADGWSIAYNALPPTPEERKAREEALSATQARLRNAVELGFLTQDEAAAEYRKRMEQETI